MSRFSAIELSKLPSPDAVETLDFKQILGEMKANLIARDPTLETALSFESEPITKLLEVCAYRELILRQRINDASRSVMLAYAKGSDLDHLAALFGVERQTRDTALTNQDFENDDHFRQRISVMLAHAKDGVLDYIAEALGLSRKVIQQEDGTQAPGTEEPAFPDEDDERLRRRIQLSLEGHSTARPIGSYVFWALSASPKVKDVDVYSPPSRPGDVIVTILSFVDKKKKNDGLSPEEIESSEENDGTPSMELVDIVDKALNDKDVRPLTDKVTVEKATIVRYEIEASLVLYQGPDAEVVGKEAIKAVCKYVDDHHSLGHDITLSGLYAALHQPGVQRVELVAPTGNITIERNEAAYCEAINISWEEERDE